ncbi:SPOR domain-containing protein [Sphingomonas glaciei]|uniref:SPOR domain-containing protein n=1 Tax=Sphingomonas glaciei TaxID=2938948 RepID=A0ABY5MZJ8_9SPHN|nr:SPOR domain-containing protein [Sphingomonas glaciei]UUR07786.1 SPOR domain-containing protein [Sphingomonas glaciei]
MWPWYLLLALVVAAVAAGAWWLSTGKEAAPPELPAEQSIPIPVTQATPAEPGTELTDPAEPVADTAPFSPARTSPRPVRRTAQRSAAPSEPGEAASPEGSVGRSFFPADDASATLPAPGPTSVATYNPRPYGGRVVQLGAFPTRAQAEVNWQRITRRYPYLATKSKMVNTVDVRGLGGGRPTRMFRLQLGTSSQAQSVVICQQLERAGHSCVVVY